MDAVTAALRLSHAEIEPVSLLAQAMFLAGIVVLILLFVGFVFWRVHHTSRDR